MLWPSSQMILVRKSSYWSLQLTSCEEHLIIWNIHCIHRKSRCIRGSDDMFSCTPWCHGWNSTSWAAGSLCLALSLVHFFGLHLWTRVRIMNFVRQSRKATLHFIEFWIIFIFSSKKLKNVHILINTHDLTPDIFIFKLAVCILLIIFDLQILDCLFVLLQ